ncbi:hypothetical protein WG66_012974 [Moniliophthora roreri]|nr:hypothetical protein WG66_012974 [Moniliophthora roreri]
MIIMYFGHYNVFHSFYSNIFRCPFR